MALKQARPRTSSTRQKLGILFEELTAKEPEKSLTSGLPKTSGRQKGKLTVRHKGGRHKRLFRLIDFKRDKHNIWAKVETIEYDPNRSSFIALLLYKDGEKRYILAPQGLKVGEAVIAGEKIEPKVGNAMPLAKMPLGSIVHNIELIPGMGGKIVRSAGSSAVLMNREANNAQLKMPSGEIRLIPSLCWATIGELSNPDHKNIHFGKAGRKRWLGIRPTVRGVAMHPNAHPHGGGEGKTGTGMPPKTPWGKPAHGKKTRKKKASDRLIIKRRK